MADNFSIPNFAGAAVVVAAKLDGGVYTLRKALSIWNGAAFADLTFGQAAMAASLPVVIASNQSAIPVTGTFYQATQPVSGTFWQTTQPVSIAATVTVDTELPTAAALADGASVPTTPKVGSCLLGYNGATFDMVRVPTVFKDIANVAAGSGGGADLWTPTSGKKFRLMGGCVSVSELASLLFTDGSGGTTVFRTGKIPADTPFNFDVPQGVKSGAANTHLYCLTSAAADLTGTVWGTEE